MRIALFDYKTIPNNPIGGCQLRLLAGLCKEYDFTVFAVEFENPCPDRIDWVRIRVPTRPLALLFVCFWIVAPIKFWWYKLRRRAKFDLVQIVESNAPMGTLSYSQFCHRSFLKHHWKVIGVKGLRGAVKYLDHWLHARVEPFVYRRVNSIVVASNGLARELKAEYPFTAPKVHVLPNPVDLDRMCLPLDFDRNKLRADFGLAPDDIVLVFVALGHFERKGLPLVLQAMTQVAEPRLKLLIVGGQPEVQASWKKKVASMNLQDKVVFAGLHRDVRPFLWASDAFAFPSYYEVFSLAALEAAAAGLPLISTPINGMEEFLVDGENGYQVGHDADQVAQGLRRFLAASPEQRKSIGASARQSVSRYSVEAFCENWRRAYAA